MILRKRRTQGVVILLGVWFSLVAWAGCEQESERRPETESATVPATAPATQGGRDMAIKLTSEAFDQNERIPKKYTGEGKDVSPSLEWTGLPGQTKQLAMIMDDPDAPREDPWVHWVIYNIPADIEFMQEGVATRRKLSEPEGAAQGENSWGNIGYGGPMPPPGHGVHHYHFKLYALDSRLDLKPGLSKKQLLNAMRAHVLAHGELIGTYER